MTVGRDGLLRYEDRRHPERARPLGPAEILGLCEAATQ